MAIIRPGRQAQPRLAEIGRLFKGAPKGPRSPGEDLDHFRFEPHEALQGYPRTDGQSGSLYDELLQRYEDLDSQRVLRIRFPFDEIEQNMSPPLNELWSSKGGAQRCIKRCDGQTQLLHWQDSKSGPRLSRQPKPCEAGPNDDKCPAGCSPTSRLQFILTDLGYPGIVVHTSHSMYDINEFESNLEAYRELPLSKIPFLLCRRLKPCPFTKPDGAIVNQSKWLCHLEIDPTYGQKLQLAQATSFLASLGADVAQAQALPSLSSSSHRHAMPMLPDDDDETATVAVDAVVDQDDETATSYVAGAMIAYCDRLAELTEAQQIETMMQWALAERQLSDIAARDFNDDEAAAAAEIEQIAQERLSELSATSA